MIKANMTTYMLIRTILLLIMMVIGLQGEIMAKTWEDTEEFKNIQLQAANLAPVASEMDSVYQSLFKSGPAGYEDWDMTKLATIEDGKYTSHSKYAKDPLSNYMTTRMMLMKDPREIPQNITGQAGLWKQIWNTLSGGGDITEFADKHSKFRKNSNPVPMIDAVEDTMNNYHNTRGAFYGKK
jgi:hypothetical protein